MTLNLFDNLAETDRRNESLGPGAMLLRQFAVKDESALLSSISHILEQAPFRHMVTPGGFRMSIAMTNCGPLGWVSDAKGYRYEPLDPLSGKPWPPIISQTKPRKISISGAGSTSKSELPAT